MPWESFSLPAGARIIEDSRSDSGTGTALIESDDRKRGSYSDMSCRSDRGDLLGAIAASTKEAEWGLEDISEVAAHCADLEACLDALKGRRSLKSRGAAKDSTTVPHAVLMQELEARCSKMSSKFNVVETSVVEVPQVFDVHNISVVPRVEVQEVVRSKPSVEIRERVKEVPKVDVQVVERLVEVPEVKYLQKIVEVPQVQIVEKIVEVPTVRVHEIVKHVPRVHVQEIVRHVPKVEVQEIVRQIPKYEVKVVEKLVGAPAVETVERIAETPLFAGDVVERIPVLVEKMVEIPQFVEKTQEIVAQVPVLAAAADGTERVVPTQISKLGSAGALAVSAQKAVAQGVPPLTLTEGTWQLPSSMAVMGFDTTRDGRPNVLYVGADLENNGIPDALQGTVPCNGFADQGTSLQSPEVQQFVQMQSGSPLASSLGAVQPAPILLSGGNVSGTSALGSAPLSAGAPLYATQIARSNSLRSAPGIRSATQLGHATGEEASRNDTPRSGCGNFCAGTLQSTSTATSFAVAGGSSRLEGPPRSQTALRPYTGPILSAPAHLHRIDAQLSAELPLGTFPTVAMQPNAT